MRCNDLALIQVAFLRAHNLIGLMPLSHQYNHIVFLRVIHSVHNCRSTVFHYNMGRLGTIHPRQNILNDTSGVLCPGIV